MKNRKIYRLYEHIKPFLNYSIDVEEPFGDGKVLVIAPHQIEEAVGCGGTLIRHTEEGGYIEIAFCTSATPERMKEAAQSASLLGSKKNHFLQFYSGGLNINEKFEIALQKLFIQVKPDIVFLPFWIDNHPDNTEISKALLKIGKNKKFSFMVYAYSIWTPLIANCLCDISGVWETKERAIKCYKSQTENRNYVKIARSINSYWGEIGKQKMNFAEPFFRASFKEYIALGKKILK